MLLKHVVSSSPAHWRSDVVCLKHRESKRLVRWERLLWHFFPIAVCSVRLCVIEETRLEPLMPDSRRQRTSEAAEFPLKALKFFFFSPKIIVQIVIIVSGTGYIRTKDSNSLFRMQQLHCNCPRCTTCRATVWNCRHNEDHLSINQQMLLCCQNKASHIYIHRAHTDSIALNKKAASWGVEVAQLVCHPPLSLSIISVSLFCQPTDKGKPTKISSLWSAALMHTSPGGSGSEQQCSYAWGKCPCHCVCTCWGTFWTTLLTYGFTLSKPQHLGYLHQWWWTHMT